jgi:hypothetical protein
MNSMEFATPIVPVWCCAVSAFPSVQHFKTFKELAWTLVHQARSSMPTKSANHAMSNALGVAPLPTMVPSARVKPPS